MSEDFKTREGGWMVIEALIDHYFPNEASTVRIVHVMPIKQNSESQPNR